MTDEPTNAGFGEHTTDVEDGAKADTVKMAEIIDKHRIPMITTENIVFVFPFPFSCYVVTCIYIYL